MEFLPKPVFCITNVGMIGCVESGFAQSSGFSRKSKICVSQKPKVFEDFVSSLTVGSILKKPVIREDGITER